MTTAPSVTVTGQWNGKVENFHFNIASKKKCIASWGYKTNWTCLQNAHYLPATSAVRRMVQRYCYWACIWGAMSMNIASNASHPESCAFPQHLKTCMATSKIFIYLPLVSIILSHSVLYNFTVKTAQFNNNNKLIKWSCLLTE